MNLVLRLENLPVVDADRIPGKENSYSLFWVDPGVHLNGLKLLETTPLRHRELQEVRWVADSPEALILEVECASPVALKLSIRFELPRFREMLTLMANSKSVAFLARSGQEQGEQPFLTLTPSNLPPFLSLANPEATMQFPDKELLCRDCSKTFLFTAGEQDYYLQKGLENLPKRCTVCRRKRWEEASAGLEPEAKPRAVPVITELSCAECGIPTTVPFKPRLNLPTYCKPCYLKIKTVVTVQES